MERPELLTATRHLTVPTALVLSIRGKVLGSVFEVDGGFLVATRRKPVPTLQLAAKQLIDRQLNHLRDEMDKWRRHLDDLRASTGPIPPR